MQQVGWSLSHGWWPVIDRGLHGRQELLLVKRFRLVRKALAIVVRPRPLEAWCISHAAPSANRAERTRVSLLMHLLLGARLFQARPNSKCQGRIRGAQLSKVTQCSRCLQSACTISGTPGNTEEVGTSHNKQSQAPHWLNSWPAHYPPVPLH